jgi:hypothetical protein
MIRTKLILAATAVAAGGQVAHAQTCGSRSLDEIIASCDAAFPGYNPIIMSARGWCYIINGASCLT